MKLKSVITLTVMMASVAAIAAPGVQAPKMTLKSGIEQYRTSESFKTRTGKEVKISAEGLVTLGKNLDSNIKYADRTTELVSKKFDKADSSKVRTLLLEVGGDKAKLLENIIATKEVVEQIIRDQKKEDLVDAVEVKRAEVMNERLNDMMDIVLNSQLANNSGREAQIVKKINEILNDMIIKEYTAEELASWGPTLNRIAEVLTGDQRNLSKDLKDAIDKDNKGKVEEVLNCKG